MLSRPPCLWIFDASALLLACLVLVNIPATAGELRIAGGNSAGQLATGERDYYPVFVELATGVEAIDLGDPFGIFMDEGGTAWGIGATWPGLLGSYVSPDGKYVTSTPVKIPETIDQFWTFRNWTFYRFPDDPYLYSSGYASFGIWDGPLNQETPKRFFDIKDVVDIAADWTGALFLTDNGDLYAVGLGFGFGNYFEDYLTPTLIANDVKEIGMAEFYAYYLTHSGKLFSYPKGDAIASNVATIAKNCSSNRSIYFIDQEANLKSIPRDGGGVVTYASDARTVEVEGKDVFFSTLNGDLYAFGDNTHGRFGLGDFANRHAPQLIMSGVKQIVANSTTLWVLNEDKTLYGSGHNSYSLLVREQTPPVRVPKLFASQALDVAFGSGTVYFVDSENALYSVGINDYGQLGLGHHNYQTEIQQVATSINSVSAGNGHALFVDMEGTLWGMGRNRSSQIKGTVTSYNLPTPMDDSVLRASAGTLLSAWQKKDGSLWIAGDHNDSYKKIADFVIDFECTDGITYINAQHELITIGTRFLSEYKTHTGSENMLESMLIDTGAIGLSVGNATIAYIKDDHSLWVVGNLGYSGSSGTFVAEPFQLDDNVSKVRSDFGVIAYQKFDDSLWIQTVNRGHLPPWIEELPSSPIRIWPDAAISNFSLSSSNIALFTEPAPIPKIESISYNKDGAIDPGDPIKLAIQTTGSFFSYQWYEGQLGDRSSPIDGAIHDEFQFYPYTTSTYWVEISYESGSNSAESEVEISFPEYGEWALMKGLAGASGSYGNDPDGDDSSNLFEFAFDTNPLNPEPPAITFERNLAETNLKLSMPTIDELLLDATVEVFDPSQRSWTLHSQLVKSEDIASVEFDLNQVDPGLLVRITLKPRAVDVKLP